MIRLIRIGDQISEGHEDFAFWDTVHDCFVNIDGDTVWSCRAEFEWCCRHHSDPQGNDVVWQGFDRLRSFLDSAATDKPGGWVLDSDGGVYND